MSEKHLTEDELFLKRQRDFLVRLRQIGFKDAKIIDGGKPCRNNIPEDRELLIVK